MTTPRSPESGNGPIGFKKPREFRIRAEIANDDRLSDRAVRAYLRLLNCQYNGLATISLPRIAEHLKCVRSTAASAIKELLDAGHVRIHIKGKQHEPNVYAIVAKLGEQASGLSYGYQSQASEKMAAGVRNPTARHPTDRTHTSSLSNSLSTENEERTATKDAVRQGLDDALAERHADGEIECPQRWLPHHPKMYAGHFSDAKRLGEKNPAEYAERKTRRGEWPSSWTLREPSISTP